MWSFWFFTALNGDPTEWTSSARNFTRPRFTQPKTDKEGRGAFPVSVDLSRHETLGGGTLCGLSQ